MEGNYFFQWQEVSAAGICQGIYEQTIYGESLTNAIKYFEGFHGTLGPDENGYCLVITTISWTPA